MAWTTPTDRTTGYVVTAVDWNVVEDNLAYLHGDAGGVNLTAGNALYEFRQVQVLGAIPGNAAVMANVVGDTGFRFQFTAGGTLSWGDGTNAVDTGLARTSAGVLTLINGNGFGYGAGTGGTVTQATSLNTGVTLNKPTGQITLFTTSTSSGSLFAFTVTNSCVAATDTVVISGSSATATNMDGFLCSVTSVNAGSFRVSIYTPLAVASATRMLNFAVIKGATS